MDSHDGTKARRDKEAVAAIIVDLPLGLLINFGSSTFKDSCKRIVNGPQSFAASCLRVNQNP